MSAQSFADKLQRDENAPQTSKELPRVWVDHGHEHIFAYYANSSMRPLIEYLSLSEHKAALDEILAMGKGDKNEK